MISPFSPPKINSGDKASIVNDASIWNSQFKTRLFNLSQNLQNAIQENDGRNVEYFLGLIARLQYHPTNHWTTFMPIDMLLLPKTPRCYRKGHKNHRKKSQLASSSTVLFSFVYAHKKHAAIEFQVVLECRGAYFYVRSKQVLLHYEELELPKLISKTAYPDRIRNWYLFFE